MFTNFRTLTLAINFYHQVKNLKFPNRHMKDQYDRALLSVLLNLAEGSAKPTKKDRLKFYSIAMGSLREVQLLLAITGNNRLKALSDPTAASLYCLCKSLK